MLALSMWALSARDVEQARRVIDRPAWTEEMEIAGLA
jgi:hypothetical protein